jgi:hypothetical protein
MARQVDERWSRAAIDGLLRILCVAGLARDRGQAIHELHPVLTEFLAAGAAVADGVDVWRRAFVDATARLADRCATMPADEQRGAFVVHGATFHRALALADSLGLEAHAAALTQALAFHAQNTCVSCGSEPARSSPSCERLGMRRKLARTQLGISF